MMQVSSIPAHRDHSAPAPRTRKAAFASAAAAGLIALSACTPQTPNDVPAIIEVRSKLREPPSTLAEDLGEATQSDLNGKITLCMGYSSCTLDVEPGDILLSYRFLPEQEGRIEISVTRTADPGVSFEQTTEFRLGSPTYDNQTVMSGEKARLFNTDLTISVTKGDAGRFYVNLE